MGGKYGSQGRLEAATTSDTLICDYLVSQGILKPDNCGKHDLWQTLSQPVL